MGDRSRGKRLPLKVPIHYANPEADVPPGVDFLDAGQARAWVSACERDKPWRVPMRLRFSELLGGLPQGASVLELGSGPGLLAECVLERCPNVERYTLLDFSELMLDLSRERLARFGAARFVQADFKTPDWTRALDPPYSAVIAMQAVHEIRHKRHVPVLYRQIRDLLAPGGLVAVCDGTPGDAPDLRKMSLHMTADEQLHALAAAGFSDATLDSAIGAMILVTARRAS